jgi:DNA primase catalytic subunit
MDVYRVIYSFHASERMLERNISKEDVNRALLLGEVIEHDLDISKSLILYWCGRRPIHVVVITNGLDKTKRIITAYEPNTDRWKHNFRRRK